MIKEEVKQEILNRADILEVVGDFVTLKKAGTNYKGKCPFHNEKTPSFMVSPAKQIYKCFGCGAAGGPVNFIMEHERKSFPEALIHLAAKYNILIEEEKPLGPDHQKIIELKEKLLHLNELALKFYHSFESFWDPDKAVSTEYLLHRFTRDEILQWKIGFAPDSWNALLDHFKERKVKDDYLERSDLFGFSKKSGNYYDYFRNRVIFPVFDNAGRVVGFGGRVMPSKDKAKEDIKYLNSPESDIYHKSMILYGMNFARKPILKKDLCLVVEGYTDVISMHSAGMEHTVAPCGTALTKEQVQQVKRFTKNIVLIYDGDAAGRKAAEKNSRICIEQGMNTYIVQLPDGEDPDSLCKKKGMDVAAWIEENKQDYIVNRAKTLLETSSEDLVLRHEAIGDICGMLFHLEKSKQELYVEQISKGTKLKPKLFNDKLAELRAEMEPEEKTWVPPDVDPNEFERWGFYAYKNEYYFRTKSGIEKLSNFIMRPVFHIDSIYDSRRIYEMINVHGYRVVVNLDMNEMTGLQAFQRNVEAKGNFMFWGQMSQFQRLKLKLYEETRTCQEIKVLGWQREGFWAWSNGIINGGQFEEIDEFGIVNHEDHNFFIPAFSKIYISDKTVFLDERKFKYIKRDVTIQQWTGLFVKVFGDNARVGIAFWCATLFRDYLLHIFKNFPILNLFGPKGTGKSQMAMSMSCLFGIQQTPFNIHNGTKPGLAEHIQQFSNAFAWVDEYKNALEYDKIETLKSIYDAIGRSRMNMDKGRKKETTEVNSAVILSGQEMPTADVALFSRVIFLQFHQTEFSQEEKKYYDDLKSMERKGLSHLSAQLIHHRKFFEENFYQNYEQVLGDFFQDTKNNVIEDRILRSMCTIVAAFKTMSEKVDFGFTYEELRSIAIRAIRDQNSQVQRSNEIGIFWNNLEAMFDDNVMVDKWHFRIDFTDTLKLTSNEVLLPGAKNVLKFKYNSIYKLYAENVRKQGIKPLPSDTLRYYLENNKHFLGVQKSCKFFRSDFDVDQGQRIEKKQVTTAFCFDYDKLGINLERNPTEMLERESDDAKIDFPVDKVMAENDNLPF